MFTSSKNSRFWKYRQYWDKENPDQQAITKSSIIKVDFVLQTKSNEQLLDAGCGSGLLTEWLRNNKGYDVTGVDASDEAGKLCSTHNIPFKRVNLETDKLPFLDKSFDVATCFELIEHIRNPENLLKEIHRVLRPDGILYISTPNIAWWYLRLKLLLGVGVWDFHDSDHIRFFTPQLLEECLNDYSFTVIDRKSISVIPRLVLWETKFLESLSYDFCFQCKQATASKYY